MPPDPSPRRRWVASALPLDELCLGAPPSKERPLCVAVPSQGSRLRSSFAINTVYEAGLPEGSFVGVGEKVQIPSPELLFVELSGVMSVPAHVMLGYELCGSFARDADDPREGDVAFGCEPLTSVAKITAFLDSCRQVVGTGRARRNLAYVQDNAWSPMEAVVATLLSLPVEDLGYGLGPICLNVRHENPKALVERGCAASRVPDMELVGTPLGLNYDGRGHFDLDSIVFAQAGKAAAAADAVRKKYVDDLRRNRELAAGGHLVLPVASEDLFAQGGLDAVVLEVILALEAFGHSMPTASRACLESGGLATARQELIWSLLPWSEATRYARELATREERATSQAEERIYV